MKLDKNAKDIKMCSLVIYLYVIFRIRKYYTHLNKYVYAYVHVIYSEEEQGRDILTVAINDKILMDRKMQKSLNPPSFFYVENTEPSTGKYRSITAKGNLKLKIEKRITRERLIALMNSILLSQPDLLSYYLTCKCA